MPGLDKEIRQKIRTIDGDGLAYVTRGYLIAIAEELEQLAIPSEVDENQINIEDLEAYISDLYADGEGRLGERQLEELVRYILITARKPEDGTLALSLSAKESIMVHQLYCLGADLVFSIIDPNSIEQATGFIAMNMKKEELHVIRDKMTNLARQITPETYASLGVKKVELDV